ncbi:hypothetical protein PWKp15_00052 [Klebsiella phage PWKp15]|nr:hypothetical protein PWKp15_00052 [Klebsiella phage PWKp15]
MKTLSALLMAVYGAAIIGWIMNIVDAFGAHGDELMIRIIGIFVAPAGAFMGWFM